jgi:DNA repair protein RecO (recombination protein O)
MTAERRALEPGWVLHGRAYRESSEILELLTREHGRVSVVARGMRRAGNPWRGLLQPFRPLLLSWGARGSGLATLHAAEAAGPPLDLVGRPLLSAWYANELLLRFLERGDPHPRLEASYRATLGALLAHGLGPAGEWALRRFEMVLLAESGYGLILDRLADSGAPLDPAGSYEYRLEAGPVARPPGSPGAFPGADLMQLAAAGETLPDARALRHARQLLRTVLDHHLGGRPLRSRAVYAAIRRSPAAS